MNLSLEALRLVLGFRTQLQMDIGYEVRLPRQFAHLRQPLEIASELAQN